MIPTAQQVIKGMRATFEHRVAISGEFPARAEAPMPEAYRRALEAQRVARQTAKANQEPSS